MTSRAIFQPQNSSAEAVKTEALVFIAQRLSGIEYQLGEIALNLNKGNSSLNSIAHVLPNLKGR